MRTIASARFEDELRETAALRREHTVTHIVWSAGDDDEHAWYWQGLNARGRTLASGYSHTQDEETVLVAIGEQGAHVAEDVAWETESR